MILDLTPLEDDRIYERFLSDMPDHGYWKMRRDKIKRFRFKADMIRSLGAGLLLLDVLRKNGMEDADISIARYGKPVIKDSRFQFNMSHSGNYAVISYGSADSGIDIEGYKSAVNEAAEHFFHSEEYGLVKKYGDRMFIRIWTLKESFLKYKGTGLSSGLDYFRICPDVQERTVQGSDLSVPLFSDKAFVGNEEHIHFAEFTAHGNHIAVCSDETIDKNMSVCDLFDRY